MATCLIVQHVAAEPSWAIGAALDRACVRADVRRTFAGDTLPRDTSGHDGVVVMGGPMSVCSDEGFPDLQTEVALLQDALKRGLPTLGVCLGAQALALAAGGHVYRGADGAEVGWGTVDFLADARSDALLCGFPGRLTVLHWHGDTFDLPPGAIHLARNERYPNQAFRVAERAWGLQFHLEVTSDAVDGLLDAFPGDANRAPGGAAALVTATADALTELATWRDLAFDRFAALVEASGRVGQPCGSPGDFADISEP